MYDGISIWTVQKDLAAYLLGCSELKFATSYPNDNPDHVTYTAKYHGLTITISPSGLVRIRGSLHKFYNEGLHNYDDFTMTKLNDTIIHLRDNFNIDPLVATIHEIEFGFNVILPYSPTDFVDNILSYKGKSFNSQYDGNYKECELHQLLLKFYNKGLQYHQQENILRAELKINKMAGYKGGSLVLNDLLSRPTWEASASQLLGNYNHLVINDVINTRLLNDRQKQIYEFGINPNNWTSKKLSPQSRYIQKHQFTNIINKYGENQYKQQVHDLLLAKYDELLKG
jgi:hypothetical protein